MENLQNSDSLPELDAFNAETLEKLKLRHQASVIGSNSEKILEEASLDGLKKYIEEGNCKNIVVIAGAGMSTSAGIPDFRTPKTGIYNIIRERYNLDEPRDIFEIEFFRKNPLPFYTLAKEGSMFEPVEPTPAHYFVKLLENKGLLLRHYTQNIDGLDLKAGVSEEKVMEAHGNFERSYCTGCKVVYPFQWFKEQVLSADAPYCTECKEVVRPDIVLFGEEPPVEFFSSVQNDFQKCDLLIIMGTSLTVEPFSSLVDHVPISCPRLLINREKVGVVDEGTMLKRLQEHLLSQDDFKDVGVDLSSKLAHVAGLNFEDPDNRDIALIGDCDDGVMKFAASLGWKTELQNLIPTSNSDPNSA